MLLSPVKKILVNMCGIVKKPYLLLNTKYMDRKIDMYYILC